MNQQTQLTYQQTKSKILSKTELLLENYKNFASWTVKYNLLKAAIFYLNKNQKAVYTLLDLASKKGNDLKKWSNLNIPRVIGIDVSIKQHSEAIIRYKKIRSQNSAGGPRVSYILGSATDYNLVRRSINFQKVNLITTNFALNYFFKDPETIDMFFKTVSDSLDKGGLFIGTATEDPRSCKELKTEFYEIILPSGSEPRNSYQFKIETPFFDNGFITEYVITRAHLIMSASKFGLEPVEIITGMRPIFNFHDYYKQLQEHDKVSQFQQLPMELVKLYFGFSFIKV